MKRIILTGIFTLLIFPLFCFSQQQAVKSNEIEDYSDVAIMLEKTGANYKKVGVGYWVMVVKGEQKEWELNIISSKELITLIILVKESAENISKETLFKLLEYNDKFDKGKFSINKGNLYFRIDVTRRISDALEMAQNIRQVSAVSDKVYGELKK